MLVAAQLGAGELQVAAGGGIEHQGIAGVPAGGRLQRHLLSAFGIAGQALAEGAVEVVHQAAGGPQGQRQLPQPQAIEAGQPEALLEGGAGLRQLEGGARQAGAVQAFGAPGGLFRDGAIRRLAAAIGPEHLGGLHLQQLLMQGIAAGAFGDAEFTGADIGHRQAPAAGLAAWALQHHGAEPVVAPRRQHPLLQHGAGGEHAGDLAPQQFALGVAPG